MDVLDTCHVTSTFDTILIYLVLFLSLRSKFVKMGKSKQKQRSSSSTQEPVSTGLKDYQCPVLPINELTAIGHGKLDTLCLRAVMVIICK